MGFGIGAWLAIAGIAASLIGAGVSAYASSEQAATQKKAAEADASLKQQEAESMRQSAEYEERQYRRRITLLLGKESAITSASGFDPTSGSPLLMELDNVRQGEMEALNIRRTGQVNASARSFEGRLAAMKAGYYSMQGGFGVASSITGAGSSILSSWSTYQNRKSPDLSYGGYYP